MTTRGLWIICIPLMALYLIACDGGPNAPSRHCVTSDHEDSLSEPVTDKLVSDGYTYGSEGWCR